MKTGHALITEIDATEVHSGDAVFWWLGQHSFIVKTSCATLYFDPYLSEDPGREVPTLLLPEEVTNATVVFGSHDHGDHIDHPSLRGIATASPQAWFLVPKSARPVLEGLGISQEQIVAIDAEETWESSGVRVTAIASAHEFFDRAETTGYPYLGFIVRSGGVTIYHSGDTLRYEGLETRLKRANVELAFLPINGRDAERLRMGCIGNMTYQEAADLAGAIRPRLTVPAHYEMFASNSEDPRLFSDYMQAKYPDLRVWVGPHGTPVRLSALLNKRSMTG